jgi:hypothetical protein
MHSTAITYMKLVSETASYLVVLELSGRTELVVGLAGTDVVARREQTLDGQGDAHGVEHAIVGRDPGLSKQLRSSTTIHVATYTIVGDLGVSVEHHAEEQDPHEDVPHVGKDVVEVAHPPGGVSAQEIIVAHILVASPVHHSLVRRDQLHHRDAVENGDAQNVPQVVVRPPPVFGRRPGQEVDSELVVGEELFLVFRRDPGLDHEVCVTLESICGVARFARQVGSQGTPSGERKHHDDGKDVKGSDRAQSDQRRDTIVFAVDTLDDGEVYDGSTIRCDDIGVFVASWKQRVLLAALVIVSFSNED